MDAFVRKKEINWSFVVIIKKHEFEKSIARIRSKARTRGIVPNLPSGSLSFRVHLLPALSKPETGRNVFPDESAPCRFRYGYIGMFYRARIKHRRGTQLLNNEIVDELFISAAFSTTSWKRWNPIKTPH